MPNIPPPPPSSDQRTAWEDEVLATLQAIQASTAATRQYLGWIVFVFIVLPVLLGILYYASNSST